MATAKIKRPQIPVPPRPPQEAFWDRLLFATTCLWTFLALCFPMVDTDFWWHLKTGEWMLATGSIPYVDLYTFTDADKPWIDLHWGFQLLITLLYHAGGVPLVTLVKAAVITAAIASAWRAGGKGLPAWKKSALWLLPIVCITGRGNERPEMLSLLFLAMWLWVATRTDRNPKWIWCLPLLQLVWVNCHALFVLGLVVGFCYAIDALAREMADGRFGLAPRVNGPDLRTVWIAGGFVAAACLVNPYFEEGALFPLTLFRKFSVEKAFYCANIGEFQPPIEFVRRAGIRAFMNIYLVAELGTWLIAAASFCMLSLKRRRWSLFRVMLFVGYSHLAWQATRNTNVFALVAGFIACENLADARLERPAISAIPVAWRADRTSKAMFAVMATLCILVISGIWNQIGEKNKPFQLGEAPHWFIHDAAKFAGQPGFPMHAFVANNGQAEVYVYHNGPEHRVFMDARLEVCTKETFKLFNTVLEKMALGDPSWQGLFQGGELPVVILDSRTCRFPIIGMLQNPNWRLVFADRAAAVFLSRDLADKMKLPMVDFTPLHYPDGPPKNSSAGN